MKITKSQLKQIIKEEIGIIVENTSMPHGELNQAMDLVKAVYHQGNDETRELVRQVVNELHRQFGGEDLELD